jgi:SAM-dependent methyltransferase
MDQPGNDKQVERARYEARAQQALSDDLARLGPPGAIGIPAELREPYLVYERLVQRHARPGLRVLDLCCGNGQHSLAAARLGARVTVSDIAPHNVALALARAQAAGCEVEGVPADAESLPFESHTFDVVTMAGSLSYVDLETFLAELRRVLRPGGAFIFVDSLNHNPIYRFNRWRHYRRGARSRSTLERMPTLATLERLRREFPDLSVSFHGILAFLTPVLRVMGGERAAQCLNWSDRLLTAGRRHAFKIVGVGHLSR